MINDEDDCVRRRRSFARFVFNKGWWMCDERVRGLGRGEGVAGCEAGICGKVEAASGGLRCTRGQVLSSPTLLRRVAEYFGRGGGGGGGVSAKGR